MAAVFATSSCDDRLGSDWAAHKTPRPKTGLGDDDEDRREGVGLGLGLGPGPDYMLMFATDSMWRCGSAHRSVQRNPTCLPSAPIWTAGALRLTLKTPNALPSFFIHHPLEASARQSGFSACRLPQACVDTIANVSRQWSRLPQQSRPNKGRWEAELLEAPENLPGEDCDPPPSYNDSARDNPPPYTLHDTPVQPTPPPQPRLSGIDTSKLTAVALPPLMTTPKPDWGATSNFRQVKNKKKQQEKKKADSGDGPGDEGNREDGDGEGTNGGDAGGGGVGGAGAGAGAGGGDDGDGGAGGDGGEDDLWNSSSKKKKKGKKNKAGQDEEEEKKKAEEEAERVLKEQEEEDERKKKEAEDAAPAADLPSWADGDGADLDADWGYAKPEKKAKKGKKAKEEEEKRKKEEEEEEKKKKEEDAAADAGDPPSWADADAADPSADWGGFTTEKKGKKGKKGLEAVDEKKKKDEEGPRSPDDPIAWADAGQADSGTAWGAFTTNDKKGKKNKKGKVELLPDPAPASTTAFSATFDNIDLGDGPHLDIDFGGDSQMDPKNDFAAFGSSWNTPNGLDAYGGDAETTDIADTLNPMNGTGTGAWGLTDTKKSKKKPITSSFEFGSYETHDALDELSKPDDTKEEGKGIWGAPAGKKDKKGKKKGGFDDFSSQPEAVPEPEPVNIVDDSSAPFATAASKKDKKKGKKGGLDASISELPSMPAPTPIAAEPVVEDEWGSFDPVKDKKKGKKGAIAEPEKKEAIIGFGEEPEAEQGFGWALPKKDKKKDKKIANEEPVLPEEPAPEPVLEELEKESSWAFGMKKAKKAKKGVWEESTPVEEEPLPIVPEPLVEETAGWGFGTKKDKKKGKKVVPEESGQKEPPAAVVPESETLGDDAWGDFEAKKDKKKGKKNVVDEKAPAEDLNIVEVPESPLVVEEAFPSYGKKKDKKGKKGISEVKEDPIVVADSTAAVAASNDIADNDWMDWGADKKKDKKGKNGAEAKEEEDFFGSAPPPPETADAPEPQSFGGWAGATKKDKKGKKNTKAATAEPPVVSVPDPLKNFLTDDNEVGWGGSWGLSAGKDKKQKEEEEQQEQKRREQDEREEQERWEAEKEKEQIAEKEKQKEKEKEKLKPGKRGKTNTTAAPSKAKDVPAEATADANASIDTEPFSTWGATKTKDKKKGGRKDAVLEPPPPPVPTPPAQGLTPEPTPEPFAEAVPDFDDFNTNNWASTAPTKTKGKKDGKKAVKAEEPKVESRAAKDKNGDGAFAFLQGDNPDDWSKGLLEEETPAKAARNFWGLGSGSTTKSKLAKEKEKAAEEAKKAEEAAQDLIDLDLKLDNDSLMDLIDEEVPKSFKASKLSKVSTKDSDKSSKLSDKKKKGGWNGTDSWGTPAVAAVAAVAVAAVAVAEVAAETETADDDDNTNTNGKGDSWAFWGAKKPSGNSGKKSDEPKKEISKYGLANQSDSLANHPFSLSNDPEPSWLDDQAEPPKSSKPAKSTMSSSIKPVAKLSSVAARVKALEKERLKEKPFEPLPSPPVEDFEPLINALPPPKKAGAAAKSKATAASKNALWKEKDLFEVAVEEEPKDAADSVPGSFPAEGADDDIINVITTPAVKKTNKKNAKSKKAPVMDPVDLMDLEDVPEFEDSRQPPLSAYQPPPPPAPEAPPTPPAEPAAPKPVKKERARVVRDEGASSWGFWGASPKKAVKKEVKAKDDADALSPVSKEKPGLTRSKTTKDGKEKETEKSSGKSSGSDKEKKADSRPPKSRGSSFGGLFGGPPPARTKPVRRSSVATPKNASRRQSMDIDAGLPSPPADGTPEMNSKAAKLMGTSGGKLGRKESVRGKPKASVVPDPYPIDDDDMVIVNGLEDPIINAPISRVRAPKDRSSKTKVGKEVKSTLSANHLHSIPKKTGLKLPTKPLSNHANGRVDGKQAKQVPDVVDDAIMVEAGPSNDPVGQGDLAFSVERPKPLQRSSTSAKRPGSKLMGIFGGFQKPRRMSETYERTRSKPLGDDDEGYSGRKRTATGGDDGTKRIRRDDRRIRRSERPDVTVNGLHIDSPRYDEGVRLEPENSDTKREERKATRASRGVASNEMKDPDPLDGQDRRARRRESERPRDDGHERVRESKDKKVRKEEDYDALRQEERRAKRAAKDESAPKDLGFDIPEKKSKRRERDLPEASTPVAESSSRPHRPDRHRSHTDHPLSPSGEPERRSHRSRRTPGERSSHRKSAAVDDYFDPRNGIGADALQPDLPPLTQADHKPYMHGANDHTSSWVKSQISDPALPPPLESSVLDPTPVLGPVDDDAEQEARRAARRRERRRSKYGEEDDADRRRRRRAGRDGIRSSEGSGDGDRLGRERRRSEYAGGGGRTGTGMGTGFGASGAGKRGSWFKKIGLQI